MSVLHAFLRSICQWNFIACLHIGITSYLFAHLREQQSQKLWDSDWLWLSNKHLNPHSYSALIFLTTQRVAHCAVSWKSFWHVKVLPNLTTPAVISHTQEIWTSLCIWQGCQNIIIILNLASPLPCPRSFHLSLKKYIFFLFWRCGCVGCNKGKSEEEENLLWHELPALELWGLLP